MVTTELERTIAVKKTPTDYRIDFSYQDDEAIKNMSVMWIPQNHMYSFRTSGSQVYVPIEIIQFITKEITNNEHT